MRNNPVRVQLSRAKDPRPGSDRPCYGCGQARAAKGQNGYCSARCRFDAKVTRTQGCWEWAGASHNAKGYGRFDADGRRYLAHRYSYEQSVGPIPAGSEVDHLCKNTRCVRPSHLEAVTSEEHDRRSDQGSYLRARTHCPKGHPYSGSNLRLNKRGGRHCRQCDKDRSTCL